MRSITIFNNKGGVGKTTFLCNLASYLSHFKNKKILIIDADPQCNATIYVLKKGIIDELYESSNRDTVDSFLDPLRKGKGYLSRNFKVRKSVRFKVDIVPGDPNLALSEDLLASDWKTGSTGDPRGLQTSFVFIDMLTKFSFYDYIFIDVGPSLGAINRSVLLASDYFIMPMSSDIFSIMAIKNISLSLRQWKRGVTKGLVEYENEEDSPFLIKDQEIKWKLQFIGYVTQQYTAKTVKGKRQAVKAYETIIRRAPSLIKKELIYNFSSLPSGTKYNLGEIPNLHSVVPMSQSANAPIFDLKSRDGVVGAHFAKVQDAANLYDSISTELLNTLEGIDD